MSKVTDALDVLTELEEVLALLRPAGDREQGLNRLLRQRLKRLRAVLEAPDPQPARGFGGGL